MLRAEMEKIKLEVKLLWETGVGFGAGNPNRMQQELCPGTQNCVLGPLSVPQPDAGGVGTCKTCLLASQLAACNGNQVAARC